MRALLPALCCMKYPGRISSGEFQASKHSVLSFRKRRPRRSLFRASSLGFERGVIAQRDIHIHAAARGLKTQYQRLGVLGILRPVLRGMQFRRMDAEMKSLIVERGHGIAD